MSNRPSETTTHARQTRTPSPNLVQQALQAKRQIIDRLIEGEMPLLEAVVRFQAVHREVGLPIDETLGLPSAMDHEAMCRSLIGWVHLTLSDRPEMAETVSTRLETELQRHLNQHGQISLPRID